VFLFKPADAINVMPGSDNGTPYQKDEPHAANPPAGAAIDYYLKAGFRSGVTLEVLDGSGAPVASWGEGSAVPTAAGRPG